MGSCAEDGTIIIFTALAQLYRMAWAAAFTVLLGIAVALVLLVYGVFWLLHPGTMKRYLLGKAHSG